MNWFCTGVFINASLRRFIVLARHAKKVALFPLFTPCLPPVFLPRRVSGDGFDGVKLGTQPFLVRTVSPRYLTAIPR
jgi:hypothetical protein